jgi:glutamate synthase (ferredoxin)
MEKADPSGFLYDPRDERDACGVGFVANLSGKANRGVLETAITALKNLEHRGAVGADGLTGDGAGLLTQLPSRFFAREIEKLGHNLPSDEIAVGVFFLPRGEAAAARCREASERALSERGLLCYGWRTVPVDEQIIGSKARATAPFIQHLLIGKGSTKAQEFEATLRLVRRQIEEQIADVPGLYIPSFSSRTVVYKGMFIASQLERFYSDLADPLFETALAVLHQRYSTNTFPNWALAQPFRFLAHNGEINTIAGNRNWMRARENEMLRREPQSGYARTRWSEGSDSASLDKALEYLLISGRDLTEAMMMLIPEAYENSIETDRSLRAFYEYSSCIVEPWDGPAGVSFSDGRIVGAALDRNGLRPSRYMVTRDGKVILTSEAGAVQVEQDMIVEKGRLGPGEMIAVDTAQGLLLRNSAIKRITSDQRAYASWVRRCWVFCPQRPDSGPLQISEQEIAEDQDETLRRERAVALLRRMKGFGYTSEDVDRILAPMLAEGKEPAGSMGDDTPLAVLSFKPRLLYSYFKQQFAQVTNPPIDSIREKSAMSLDTLLGVRPPLTPQALVDASLIHLKSPILSNSTLDWLKRKAGRRFVPVSLQAVFDADQAADGLQRALEKLCGDAIAAVENGATILIISDLEADEFRAPIPMLLSVGAVHNHLIREGRRLSASLIAQTGEARDDHQIACLIGCGANAVNPAVAFEVIVQEGIRQSLNVPEVLKNYVAALESGLRKIMAKMGIATVASYCGSQTFEAVGLDSALVDKAFTGAASRIGGIGIPEIATDVLRFHSAANGGGDPALEDAGYFRYRSGGEYHTFNPTVFRALHRVARNGGGFDQYSDAVAKRQPAVLRDLLAFKPGKPIPLEEVDSVELILSRFSTSGMSLGALSREAHETLAIAMNRMGAKSNSGEGGEDPARFKPYPNGDFANSRIKQVASARFGVTPEYLMSADELEIKMAQGSKPGEGGQLPGHKVTGEIAGLRHSVPGVTLISPPPHHDIYSIEDLAQLIHDLKQINTAARIAVKLVSEAGIGTIAAGVAKAHADIIHISGHDGGTGASPLGSIKNAGTPWELGLAEAHQALVLNDLRSRVRLRVDGGLKTGRDVLIAAMLGAQEFGFATAAVVAMGCVMARQCHLNTCPVGIASQEVALRKKFKGTVENVILFFTSLAEEIRSLMAGLGIRRLDDITGRSDLLFQNDDLELPRSAKLNLAAILRQPPLESSAEKMAAAALPGSTEESLGDRIARDCSEAVEDGSHYESCYEVRNTDRTVGARLAGVIASTYGDAGLPPRTIQLTFTGSAGQSFGAFNVEGVQLTLIGEANDYVGKGMNGGEIIIKPPVGSRFDWSQNVITGNTVLYGATGGALFAAGRAGERFCVRNSGGIAVVEGVGDHGCEYMTAGIVVVLGAVGRNFAAGMTGGVAYVFDELGSFSGRCNTELVAIKPTSDREAEIVRLLIERHHELTQSPRARDILANWRFYRKFFCRVAAHASTPPEGADELAPIELPVAMARRGTLAAAE